MATIDDVAKRGLSCLGATKAGELIGLPWEESIEFDDTGDTAATVHGKTRAECEAISALFQSAPALRDTNAELLAALEACEKRIRELELVCEHEWGSMAASNESMDAKKEWCDEVYAARAAIAKARGGV
jgi:hypothetical protein